MQDRRVDGDDVADVAELGVAGGGGDETGVLTREADRDRSVDVDDADDVAVHLADEHHPGDVERLGVGHPQAAPEFGHLAETGHQRADLRASTVHDDRQDADRLEQDDVLGELLEWPRRFAGPLIGEGVSSVLDDDGPPGEAADVRQRVAEHGRLDGSGKVDPAHDRPMLSST